MLLDSEGYRSTGERVCILWSRALATSGRMEAVKALPLV
jgi:hypothetical protein